MGVLEKVRATIQKYDMLQGARNVLVGLSGGADSLCLTLALHRLSARYEISLQALSVDHGMRPEETPRELGFCKDFCRDLGIRHHVEMVDVREHASSGSRNVQETARNLRYGAFESWAARLGADCIAVGHTLDDQVETLFLRLLRGSGIRGLSSIPPVRESIVRPLIELERREIEAYLHGEGISYITDVSNLSGMYLRNRVRSRLIPVVKELNPELMRVLAHTTDVFREEDQYLEVLVTKTLMRLIARQSETSIELFLVPLEGMETVILRRVIRRALEETSGLRGLSFLHVEDIMGLVRRGMAGDRTHLPGGVRAVRQYATLLITSEAPAQLERHVVQATGEVPLPEVGQLLRVDIRDATTHPDGPQLAVFDADKVPFPLIVRSRRDGDCFYPSGFGRRKKLQDFFVDQKVLREERDAVPLVVQRNDSDIIWVAGHRADERYRPDDTTTRFLVLELRTHERLENHKAGV